MSVVRKINNMSKSNPRSITYQKAYKEILDFFNGDKNKALSWYMTDNPALGGMSPYNMIKAGRGAKLMKWLHSALAGNRP